MITRHHFHLPVTLCGLTGDLTAAGARHLAVDRPSQALIGQIGPSTMTPYPYPCSATSPTTRNRNHAGEPPWNLVGNRFTDLGRFAPLTPLALPLSLTCGPVLTAPARAVSLIVGRLGRFARSAVRPRSR
jgi:hypothetical protein